MQEISAVRFNSLCFDSLRLVECSRVLKSDSTALLKHSRVLKRLISRQRKAAKSSQHAIEQHRFAGTGAVVLGSSLLAQ
jgi:hypothetical protein